ncbi:MAG: UDP-glucose/GDP-mannose dehydrogenase family protein [Acidobacteriaceae bacterium]|nr:UDP-glucose/GDP-mannose dehydrogenase family protein [Acidobacteriaceae bacterium]
MATEIASASLLNNLTENSLEGKLKTRQARVGVIGMGYVGLPLALLFSSESCLVTGFDIDGKKVQSLSSGASYIASVPSFDIAEAVGRGFSATSDFAGISQMDAIIICVPTPLSHSREPDLSFIIKTAESIAPHLRPGQLVVLESTTYPGTTEEVLVPILENNNPFGLKAARTDLDSADLFYVAFSPEREDPGNHEVARRDIPKVIGGLNTRAAEMAASLYGTVFNKTVLVSTPAAAEMTKLLENIYRCVNIALVNELKLLCSRMGIDIWEVIDAAKTKPFGFQAFYPGPGLGGHCIPVDPFYLSWKAREFDFATRFIELAGQINMEMPYNVVAAVATALNERSKMLKGAQVLVLGVAYKKDVDDLRESPALTIIELLRKSGAVVSYNDPFFPFVGQGRKYNLNMKCVPLENLGQYDCVLIVTDHSDFDYVRIVQESQLVIDTRNATRRIESQHVVYC